jgi:putative transcriptional regulator
VTPPPADGRTGDAADDSAAISVRLDALLSYRGMTLTELSALVDITVVNLSILKNGHARAIRFSTLARLCEALHCQPGDLLSYEPGPRVLADAGRPAARRHAGVSPAEPATGPRAAEA